MIILLSGPLERDGFRFNRHRALVCRLAHDLSENRCTLFRIMRYLGKSYSAGVLAPALFSQEGVRKRDFEPRPRRHFA
jgi:hypothetical protein